MPGPELYYWHPLARAAQILGVFILREPTGPHKIEVSMPPNSNVIADPHHFRSNTHPTLGELHVRWSAPCRQTAAACAR